LGKLQFKVLKTEKIHRYITEMKYEKGEGRQKNSWQIRLLKTIR
jgi:hypothetical protein